MKLILFLCVCALVPSVYIQVSPQSPSTYLIVETKPFTEHGGGRFS